MALQSRRILQQAGFPATSEISETLEIADFGLGHVREEGAQIYTIFKTEKIACKLLVLLAAQVEPEHWHPNSSDDPGKEEVLTAFWGDLLVSIPGEIKATALSVIPDGKADVYTCRNIQVLTPGESVVLSPGTKHWFAAGESGAVFFSMATVAQYLEDRFTDPAVVRKTVIEE